MTNALRPVTVVGLAAAAIFSASSAASAVPTSTTGSPTTSGYDVSYPQCGTTLPSDAAFAVVGVNGGLATRGNPCLSSQLAWAWQASHAEPTQPRAQVYLNTANPGEVRAQVTTWPRRGSTPYGACNGGNTSACSWQYGWERAAYSIRTFLTPAARAAEVDGRPGSYTWWLDVETMNTWQSGSSGALERNRATLEGMTAYLVTSGGSVGLYSTPQQWDQIVGTVPGTSPLVGLPSWLAGSTTIADATAACDGDPLVPAGRVALSQYASNGLDRNRSCL